MSIWKTLKTHAKAQLLDVIQWLDDSRDTLVYRFPIFNQAIQDGAKLVVREGQMAVFVNEGQMSEVFGPGTYTLSTRTKAIASFFESIKYSLNYPYKGDIYFVSARQITDQKWGTPNPIMMNDKQLGPVRIRAFGIYAYRIEDAGTFLREIVGTKGLFTTKEINGQLKRKLVSAFADTVGESKIPVLDLAAQYMDLGDAMRERMSPTFNESYGIGLTDFVVENVSLPPEVEKMLDKRTSMGLIGDMGAYGQFQAANAIETAAGRPGGGSNAMMDAGMGLAMGGYMGQQMMGQQGGVYNPRRGFGPAGGAVPQPPPPPNTDPVFHYSGASGQAQLNAQQIAEKVAADRGGAHNVWMPGWPGWKAWSAVPEIAGVVPPEMPPPPGAAPDVVFHYAGASGQQELGAADIAKLVAADPTGRHLVWKEGFSGWLPAADVPEIQAAAAPAPAPPPPVMAPPPPPID